MIFFNYFSEKKSFKVYTLNNISTYHMFPNKLNFESKIPYSSSGRYVEIFLMASNPDILLGDMYYIQLQIGYNYYYNTYQSYIQRCLLRKCTSGHGDHVTIHNNFRGGCKSISDNVSISVNFKLWINLIFLLLEVNALTNSLLKLFVFYECPAIFVIM
jgi:hypothetical protein